MSKDNLAAGRRDVAAGLERLITEIDRNETSQVAIEKLRSGLEIVLEREKALISQESEKSRTGFTLVQILTPVLITAGASLVALVWQSKEQDREQQAATANAALAAASAAAAASNAADERQVSRELANRRDRIALLQTLASKVVGPTPAPEASCRYALGVWNESNQDPSPLLNTACSQYLGADAGGPIVAPSAAAQWVVVVSTDSDKKTGCVEAQRAQAAGLDTVRLWSEPANRFPTTTGVLQSRDEADAYLQRVRGYRPTAFVAKLAESWKLEPCP